MEEAGLICKPKFDNPKYYLGEGPLTKQTEILRFIAGRFNGNSDEEKVRNLLAFINTEIPIKKELDDKKFGKTAEEILESRKRTGCSDSAILFSTLARAMGVPTMIIITFDKKWRDDLLKGKKIDVTVGHFYSAVYLKNKDDYGSWKIIDTHKSRRIPKDIDIKLFELDDRNIYQKGVSNTYAFAYVRDIRDVVLDGRTIDSSKSMKYIQERAAFLAKGKDISDDEFLR